MLNESDLTTLSARGITPELLQTQIDLFKSGFPWLTIKNAARPGEGITVLSPDEEEAAVARWKEFLADGGTVTKFVPASGAASRMFKALFSFVDGDADVAPEGSDVAKLLERIHDVAFFGELEAVMHRLYGKGVDAMLAEGKQKEVISGIISADGLNYGNLPKGLLTFHRAEADTTRTPLEEQMMEGAQSARQADGTVNLHLTVSGSHRDAFSAKIAEAIPAIEQKMGVKFNVSMSEQMPSTDTVAVNEDNSLFRDNNGELVFRPGGHGALIRNLNDIDTDVVFIKNIDNVVPDSLRGATLHYKMVIAGYLMQLHDKIVEYTSMIDSRSYEEADLDKVSEFLRTAFSYSAPEMTNLKGEDLAVWLRTTLERPVRVCGMVKNEGEPGGGPYIAKNPDGSFSTQILESTQIDLSKEENRAMMAQATHFNPVDLVCYVRSTSGRKFDLPRYVDPMTGFISSKSYQGRSLRALELPGLWNGAMSGWLTAFVEVPVATFNPVKTVNDLLRSQHQG